MQNFSHSHPELVWHGRLKTKSWSNIDYVFLQTDCELNQNLKSLVEAGQARHELHAGILITKDLFARLQKYSTVGRSEIYVLRCPASQVLVDFARAARPGHQLLGHLPLLAAICSAMTGRATINGIICWVAIWRAPASQSVASASLNFQGALLFCHTCSFANHSQFGTWVRSVCRLPE